MTKQVRFIPIATCGLKVREAGEGQEQSRTVVGTPIVYGVRSVNLTPWRSDREVYEVMEPGCISDQLLRESDVVLNLNHSNKVTDILGRYRGGEGTLKLTNTQLNMQSECDVAQTTAGNDTLVLMRRGDITGMSFAFEDDWEDSENGVSYERMKNEDHDGKEVWVRHVKRVTALYDVSIVTHPAYEQTSVAVREQCDAINRAIDAQIAATADAGVTEREEPTAEPTAEPATEPAAEPTAQREQPAASQEPEPQQPAVSNEEQREDPSATPVPSVAVSQQPEQPEQPEQPADTDTAEVREAIIARQRRRAQRRHIPDSFLEKLSY